MEKQDILNKIVIDSMKDNWLYDVCCKRVYDTTLRADLVQELCIIILTMKSDGIIIAYNNNEHKKYISRIFANMFYSQTSPFYRLYRNNNKFVEYNNYNMLDIDTNDDNY
jgi:hypothetical protein